MSARTPDLPAWSRRSGAVIVAAVAVAAVVVGMAAVLWPGGSDSDPGPTATPTSSQGAGPGDAGTSVVVVDHGPTDDAGAVAACAGTGYADDPAGIEVLYDVVQDAPGTTTPVLLLRNADGDLRLCDMTGPDSPATLPLPKASPDDPVVPLTNTDEAWDCDGTVLAGFRTATWLSVDPSVAGVAQRFVVGDTPGPWFRTAAVDGIAHLQTWLGPQEEGAEVVLEQRALDAAGDPVTGAGWAGSRTIAGCETGGDVQIG